MNNRLQQFLELEQMKPAQFADIMGIQRSNVSHILSGRNKPSLEFIQKFLQRFPTVNPDWFLTGKGKPYRHQTSGYDTSAAPTLFIEEDTNPLPSEEKPANNEISEAVETQSSSGTPVKVQRITLFFSDGTFQEFYPSLSHQNQPKHI